MSRAKIIVLLICAAFVVGSFSFAADRDMERSRHRCPERPVTAEDFKR